jgi:hypothetical protein
MTSYRYEITQDDERTPFSFRTKQEAEQWLERKRTT